MECTNRVNFINFLRGVNQAHDFDYMIEPVVEQLKVAKEFGVPMVFAKKSKSINIDGDMYVAEVESFTHKNKNQVIVSKKFLNESSSSVSRNVVFMRYAVASSYILYTIQYANSEVSSLNFTNTPSTFL